MIFAKFLWVNVFFGGKLQIYTKNLNFKIFESALYMKSVSMPLTWGDNGYKGGIMGENQRGTCLQGRKEREKRNGKENEKGKK